MLDGGLESLFAPGNQGCGNGVFWLKLASKQVFSSLFNPILADSYPGFDSEKKLVKS